MSVHVEPDYVTYRFPHKKIRRYMASLFRSYWKPKISGCDPVCCPYKKGKHTHFSWAALAREWKRLLLKGSREYRWD